MLGLLPYESFSGNILIHEHIACISNDMLKAFGDDWVDIKQLIKYATNILATIKEKYNVKAIVDATPIDLGRDVFIINEVSRLSGVKIIVSSGFYHFPSMVSVGRDENELAEFIIKEHKNGIENSKIKAGFLKCAIDNFGLNDDIKKRLNAIAIAQRETDLPVYIHSTHTNNEIFDAIALFQQNNASMNRIIVGHMGLKADYKYVKSILDTGCYVCIDQSHCSKQSLQSIAQNTALLCNEGYDDKILLSNDYCIYSDFASKKQALLEEKNINCSFGFIFEKFYPEFLKCGGNDFYWDKFLNKNPLKILNAI